MQFISTQACINYKSGQGLKNLEDRLSCDDSHSIAFRPKRIFRLVDSHCDIAQRCSRLKLPSYFPKHLAAYTIGHTNLLRYFYIPIKGDCKTIYMINDLAFASILHEKN
jgi:hypothetical protein